INLQQVRNPNGVFNSRVGNNFHRFDYGAASSVTLNAGNGVTLSGQNAPTGQDRLNVPSIYPPNLDITAGAGGITLLNDVILFPSATGQLNLTTTSGGPLQGLSGRGADI